eukprot:125830_1
MAGTPNRKNKPQRAARGTYGRIQSSTSASSIDQSLASEASNLVGDNSDSMNNESLLSSNYITVNILDSAQNKFEIKVSPDATVKDLKSRGAEIHSITPAQQRLIYMGQLLQDSKLLRDHNIKHESIVHLFPKPNVVISDAPTLSSSDGPNDTAINSNESSPMGAHVPQIIMDANEVNRRSSLVILTTHEAYEALHRIRLLSFLLLIYCSIQLLRDVSIWLGPPNESGSENTVIPPGDPTDTSLPGQNQYDEELPEWQNQDYVEMAICTLGIYVALLGIKTTSEHIGELARRFVVLLAILGVSWNSYLFYCYVEELKERETAEDLENGKVYQDAMMAITLPLFLWLIFYVRAMQFYYLIREAENDAQERSRNLTDVIGSPDGTTADDGEGQRSGNERGEQFDLELQEETRSIT